MRVVLQRVSEASVKVDSRIVGEIESGLLIFVGFTAGDDELIIDKMIDKIQGLRIFEDSNNKMNISLKDIKGSILSISQFTLYADVDKGRRPSFDQALGYEKAKSLYDLFNHKLSTYVDNIKTGIFGAKMEVNLINDGPVTIFIDSKNKS